MFEVTSAKVKRAIRKGAKRQEERNETMPFLNPSTVSLEKWLERYQGDTSRLDWLYSELLEYADENESAGNSLLMQMDVKSLLTNVAGGVQFSKRTFVLSVTFFYRTFVSGRQFSDRTFVSGRTFFQKSY